MATGVEIRVPVRARYIDRYGCSRDKLRHSLHKKQNGRCGICRERFGKKWLTSRHVNFDHKWCRSHGGPDVVENLQLTHSYCNSRKGATCSPGSPCYICFPEERPMAEKVECDGCHKQWIKPVAPAREDPLRAAVDVKVPAEKQGRTQGRAVRPLIDESFDLCQECGRTLVRFIKTGKLGPDQPAGE